MKLLIGLIAILPIIYLSFRYWKSAIKTVLLLVVIEGALRKWVLPQASELIYFLKDFVLVGAYIRYYGTGLVQKKLEIKINFINVMCFLAAGWCIFQAFNPSLGSPIVGIFGVKAYFFYTPLMWILADVFESESDLYKFLRSHLFLIIPVGILGVVQFFSPPSSPINSYAPGLEALGGVATFSKFARITSTFAYINNYALYLIVCFGLLIPFLSINQSRWWKLATIGEIFMVVVNLAMTGSRNPVISSALFLCCYLGANLLTRPSRALRFVRQFLPIAIIISIAAFIWFRPAIDAFWNRASSNSDVSHRIENSFTEPLRFFQYKDIDGYGTGATHGASQTLRNALGLPPGEPIATGFEAEMGRIALDLGPIGFTLWYGFRLSMIIALWLVFWKLQRPFLKNLAIAACLIQAIQIIGQVVTLHTFSVYYWFLSSFIFLLPKLERIQNFYRDLQLLNQNVQSASFPDSPDGQSQLP